MDLLIVCLSGIAFYLAARILFAKPSRSLPPGPSGWPIIKNFFDVPSHQAWLAYAELGRKYGEVSSLNVLGTPMIILNSAKGASNILDKNSAISSDRPQFVMGNELCGWKDVVTFMQNGDRLRQARKSFHRELGTKSSLSSFYPIQEEETRKFLARVLKAPECLADHIRKTAGAIILKISHGYTIREGSDPFVDMADRSMMNFSTVATPGAYLVDFIPALQYLPEWFPGAGFQRDAERYRKELLESAMVPHQFVLDEMAKGDYVPSFTSKLLEDGVTPEEEKSIMWNSLTMYLGGSDTIVSTICAFFLAMTIHPDIQRRAQAELDAVIGTGRLPTFDDRDSLPGILHDETSYPDPETFNPDRYLGENPQPDPRNHCFGYGRRICAGMDLAEGSFFIAVAMSLAVLEISRCIENGVEIIPKLELMDGVVSRPRPFKCKITPRSAKAKDLVYV
ncbi:cytochrome P450 [Phlebopus sp. FC_14]|nr:cytochrome P450 [Phlebopus sp. FC_14]